MIRAFTPAGDPINYTVTASSVTTKLVDQAGNQNVRVTNLANANVFVKFGTSTVTATTNSMVYTPGLAEVITLPPDATHVAVIGTASSGSIQFQLGVGV